MWDAVVSFSDKTKAAQVEVRSGGMEEWRRDGGVTAPAVRVLRAARMQRRKLKLQAKFESDLSCFSFKR